jgi:four helix bundle protein
MGAFQNFEEIEAWKRARNLAGEIYAISSTGPFSKDFGLREQMRRAVVSVMSNIAEGFERSGTGEFIQFLSMAKGSAGEVRAQLYVALDQSYIDRETFNRFHASTTDICRMISGLMHYLQNSGVKGTKFKKAPKE